MLRVARAVEHSLSSTITPELEQRRVDAINTLRAFPDRVGAMTLHRIITAHPVAARKAINLMLLPNRLSYLDSGADSGVYRRGDEVIKVVRSTADLPDAEKEAIARERDDSYRELAGYLGDFVLDEETSVGTHPLNPDWRVVQTHQQFYDYEKLDLFTTDDPVVDPRIVAGLAAAHPGIDDALSDFVRASVRYHDQTGMYPDTNGRNNLVVAKAPGMTELTLLDTGPISGVHPAVQVVIEGQLSSLAGAIQEIR